MADPFPCCLFLATQILPGRLCVGVGTLLGSDVCRSQTPESCPVLSPQGRLHPDGRTQKASQGPRHLKGSTEDGWGFAGLFASQISELVCSSRLQESELLRLKAFVLFGKLAKVVGISKKHFFKEEVKKAWVPLMLHCQDPCSDAAQVRQPSALHPKPRARSLQQEPMLGVCGLSWPGIPRCPVFPKAQRPQSADSSCQAGNGRVKKTCKPA